MASGKLYPSPARLSIFERLCISATTFFSPLANVKKVRISARENTQEKQKENFFFLLYVYAKNFHFSSLVSFLPTEFYCFRRWAEPYCSFFLKTLLSYICAAEKKAFTIFLVKLTRKEIFLIDVFLGNQENVEQIICFLFQYFRRYRY